MSVGFCEVCGKVLTNPNASMCQQCILTIGKKQKLDARKKLKELVKVVDDSELKVRRLKARLCLDCGKPLIGLEKKAKRCPGCRVRLASKLTGGAVQIEVLTPRDMLEKAVTNTAKVKKAQENAERSARAFSKDWKSAPARCRHCPWVTRIMPGVLYCPAADGTCMRVPTEFYERRIKA